MTDARLWKDITDAKHLRGVPCNEVLSAVIAVYGRSEFDYCADKIRKARLEIGNLRPKRVKFPWSMYRKLYDRQRGICAWCDKEMALIRGKVDMDHIDPNSEDFNGSSNLQLLHSGCNRSKNAKSIAEQSKATGKGYIELLGGE
jgi:5-methylcytosine-specific restriction endonuclease McrA